MSTNFQGRIIAITGAASGIGLATAKMLASRGAVLSLGDMNESLLHRITKDIISSGGRAFATVLDVRKRTSVESWISETVKREGRLDGAVNLAGVIGRQIGVANIEDIEDDDWDFVIGVNLGGVLNCMRAEIKAMGNPKEEGRGASIVNASSIAGIMGMLRNGAYIASKHAVVGLTRAGAKENGGKGIRVNAIAPGPINTPMVRSLGTVEDKGQAEEGLLNNVPMGREGQPEEVAELICWLLCDGSSYMTGTVQSIDGGWAC